MPLRLCEQAAGVTAASPASPCQLVPPHPPQALRLRPGGGRLGSWSAGSGAGSGVSPSLERGQRLGCRRPPSALRWQPMVRQCAAVPRWLGSAGSGTAVNYDKNKLQSGPNHFNAHWYLRFDQGIFRILLNLERMQ